MDTLVIPPKRLKRGLQLSVAASVMGMPWAAIALGMPTILWLEWLNAKGWQIGLAVMLQQLAVLFQLPVAILCEKMTHHKPVWAGLAIPHRFIWVVPAIMAMTLADTRPETVIAIMMAVIFLSAAMGAAPNALWYHWMGRLVPTNISGRFWGTRQAITMSAFILSMIWVGRYLDQAMTLGGARAFAWVFAAAGIMGTADIIVHARVPEPRMTVSTAPRETLRNRAKNMLADKDFLHFCLGMGAAMFAIGLNGAFIPVYLKREFLFSYSDQALMPIFNSIGALIAGLVLGRLIDRIGARAVLLGLILAGPLTTLGWFFIANGGWTIHTYFLRQALALAVLIHLLGGFFYGGILVCQFQMLHGLVPKRQPLFGTAFYWSMIGLIAALGPLIGGWITDWITQHPIPLHLPSGHPFGFLQALILVHIFAMWFLAFPQIRKLSLAVGQEPLRHHLLRIIPGNAFRATINTLMGPLSTPPPDKDK